MNAAATPENPRPAQTWNGSCPDTPAPKTSALGRSHPNNQANPHPATTTASPRRTGHVGYCHARSQDFRILTTDVHPIIRSRFWRDFLFWFSKRHGRVLSVSVPVLVYKSALASVTTITVRSHRGPDRRSRRAGASAPCGYQIGGAE